MNRDMSFNAQEVLEALKRIGDATQAERLEDALARGIKLTGYQANMMYLGRRYGKTIMAYVLITQEIISELENKSNSVYLHFYNHENKRPAYANHIVIDSYDYEDGLMDKIAYQRNWLKDYKNFLRAYYPELKYNTEIPTMMRFYK